MTFPIQTFTFDGKPVRAGGSQDKPWFVAKDVCANLGLTNSRMSLSRLDEDEKGVTNIDTKLGTRTVAIVYESGLYALIMRSSKPEAKRFRKWVTSEVLPAIRKTGQYAAPEVNTAPEPTGDYILAMLDAIKQVRLAELENARKVEAVKQLAEEARLEAEAAGKTAQAALDQARCNQGYYTILGYSRLHGWEMDGQEALRHGQVLSRQCKGKVVLGKVRDVRWGTVNTYPESVLDSYFEGMKNGHSDVGPVNSPN